MSGLSELCPSVYTPAIVRRANYDERRIELFIVSYDIVTATYKYRYLLQLNTENRYNYNLRLAPLLLLYRKKLHTVYLKLYKPPL